MSNQRASSHCCCGLNMAALLACDPAPGLLSKGSMAPGRHPEATDAVYDLGSTYLVVAPRASRSWLWAMDKSFSYSW